MEDCNEQKDEIAIDQLVRTGAIDEKKEEKVATKEQQTDEQVKISTILTVGMGKRSLGQNEDHPKFSQQFANSVTSVVGLQEVVSSKERWLKILWSFLVFAGIIGTGIVLIKTTQEYLGTPTATKIDVHYEDRLPPIVLCRNTWFDTEKAEKLGFSRDALSYGLGFLPQPAVQVKINNITTAKEEFQDAFQRNNFANLVDFYMSIAIDFVEADSYEGIDNRTSTYTIAQAFKSWHEPAKKVFISRGICRAFNFSLAKKLRTFHVYPRLYVKSVDNTEGIVAPERWWYIGFTTGYEFMYYDPLVVSESMFSYIKISSRKIIMRNTSRRPCHPQSQDEEYSRDRCLDNCEGDITAKKVTGCYNLGFATSSQLNDPTRKFCNWIELNNLYKQRPWDLERSLYSVEDESTINELEVCSRRCPVKCQNMFYESFVRYEEKLELNEGELHRLHSQNATGTYFLFYHGHDGMAVIKEVETYTLTSLVAAVGGTLGLFVGCTVMTVPQTILFFVSYICEKLKKAGWYRKSQKEC